MSAYPGTYTFTREQLQRLLDDVIHEVWLEHIGHNTTDCLCQQRLLHPSKVVARIAATMGALDFDATRPTPRRTRNSLPEPVPIAAQRACLQRLITQLPFLGIGRMTVAEMDHELACLHATLQTVTEGAAL